MTKAEKAFVSNRFNKQDNDSFLFIQVMKLIDSQHTYNEAAIIKALSIKRRQMARIKNYLGEYIVDAIAILNQVDEPAAEIRKLLGQKEVLFKKRLFKACEKKLLKALTIAEQAELFNYYSEIATGLIHIKEIQGDNKWLLINGKKLRVKEEALLNHQIQLAQLKNFKHEHMLKLHQLYGNNEKMKQIYGNGKRLIKQLEDINISPVKSKTAMLQYYNYLGFILYAFGDTKEALNTARKSINLFKNDRLFTQQHYRPYLHGINNYLLLGQPYLSYTEVKKTLLMLEQCATDFKNIDYIKTNALARYYYFLLMSNLKFNTEALEHTTVHVSQWLNTYNQELVDQINYTKGIEFLLSSAFFIKGNYKQSLHYAQNIINLKILNYDYHITRINFLILHFELNNFELLKSLIRSTERHFQKNYPFKDLGLCICNYLKKAIAIKSKSDLSAIFSDMLNELRYIKNDPITRMQLANFEHSNFLIIEQWCSAKLQVQTNY